MKSQNKQRLNIKETMFLLGVVLLTVSIFGYGWWVYQNNNKSLVELVKPTLEVYVQNEPRNIKIDYEGGELANIKINYETKDKAKSYIYVTTDPDKKIQQAIEQANAERTSGGVVNGENILNGGGVNQQEVGEWIDNSVGQEFTRKHQVILPSEVVQRYMLKFVPSSVDGSQADPNKYDPFLHFGTRTTANQEIALSDNKLYYFIILVDENEISLPYGDPDFTTKENGPTKGYELKLPIEI